MYEGEKRTERASSNRDAECKCRQANKQATKDSEKREMRTEWRGR